MGEVIERPHSPISGSKIKQFMHCPTSFWPHPDDLVDTSPKTAAIEGERAHDLAERCVYEGESALEGCRNKLMCFGAKSYAEYIRANGGDITTEQFIAFGNSFGFADNNYVGGYYDAMAVYDDCLHVYDYKFGFHVVESDTPQLTFYILGKIISDSVSKRDFLPVWAEEIAEAIKFYDLKTFRQTIVQPKRKDGIIHTSEITQEQLIDFASDMCGAVMRYQDSGKFIDSDCEGNEYCKYCLKRLICSKCLREERESQIQTCKFTFNPKPQ